MAVSEGCLRWKCSQCSQSCSQSVPSLGAMDSSSSQCSGFPALIPIDAVTCAIHIVQEQGTLGTLGTGLKRHEFSLPAAWNRRGTLGTGPHEASPGTNSGSTRLRHASLKFFEYVMCSSPLLPSLLRAVRRAEWVSAMGYPIVTGRCCMAVIAQYCRVHTPQCDCGIPRASPGFRFPCRSRRGGPPW